MTAKSDLLVKYSDILHNILSFSNGEMSLLTNHYIQTYLADGDRNVKTYGRDLYDALSNMYFTCDVYHDSWLSVEEGASNKGEVINEARRTLEVMSRATKK